MKALLTFPCLGLCIIGCGPQASDVIPDVASVAAAQTPTNTPGNRAIPRGTTDGPTSTPGSADRSPDRGGPLTPPGTRRPVPGGTDLDESFRQRPPTRPEPVRPTQVRPADQPGRTLRTQPPAPERKPPVVTDPGAAPAEPPQINWRFHDGRWSYWEDADKRWYYTDGRYWYFHDKDGWRLYRFDRSFGRNFARKGYAYPDKESEIRIPGHQIYVPPR